MGFTNVLDACEPHDEAFESQTETWCGTVPNCAGRGYHWNASIGKSFVVDADEEVDVVFPSAPPTISP